MAYVPSARRDSGTTRSKLRGSIAIPEAVCWGKSGGLDMMRALMRYTCEDTGGESRSKTNMEGSGRRSNQRWDCRERDLVCHQASLSEPCGNSLHQCPAYPLCKKNMRYAVLVTGPAGAGKSTFCASFMTHLQTSKRSGHLVNLDPAAAPDSFEYAPSIDIKDLISVEDATSELGYGPNGGLIYCFECVNTPFARPEWRGRAFSVGAQIPLAEYGLARGGSRRI